MHDVEDRIWSVLRTFAEDRGIDTRRLVPEAALADLGVDSMHLVDLAFRFEETFGIHIRLEDFRAQTVGDAVAFVAGLVEKR